MKPLEERRARVTVSVVRPGAEGEQALTYVFEQHRMTIQVAQGGGQFGGAKVQVYGVPLDAMNKIARLWLEVLSPSVNDKLTIDVWDGSNFVPLFAGVITWSAINASGAPHVALEIEASDAMAAQLPAVLPYSQDTPIALLDIVKQIAEPVGLAVEFAETVPPLQVQKVHLIGTAMEQLTALFSFFPELTWYINLQRVVVRPVNGPLGGSPVRIDKTTGMIGYPTYSTSGVTLATLFDARIRPGLALDIQTSFDFVNRTKWVASVLQHTIEPNKPGGQWLTQIAAQSYGSKGDTSGSAT